MGTRRGWGEQRVKDNGSMQGVEDGMDQGVEHEGSKE